MSLQRLGLTAVALLLAACSQHDGAYYVTHRDEARTKNSSCTMQQRREDKECAAAASIVVIDHDAQARNDSAPHVDLQAMCQLVADEDEAACRWDIRAADDPAEVINAYTGQPTFCAHAVDRTVHPVPPGGATVSDCAQTFALTVPEGWQWQLTVEQSVLIASPNVTAERFYSGDFINPPIGVVACFASSSPNSKAPQSAHDQSVASYADVVTTPNADQSPRIAAFTSAREVALGPAKGLFYRYVALYDAAKITVGMRAEVPGRDFRIECDFKAPLDDPPFEQSAYIPILEAMVRSLTLTNLPHY